MAATVAPFRSSATVFHRPRPKIAIIVIRDKQNETMTEGAAILPFSSQQETAKQTKSPDNRSQYIYDPNH
jgi:hypothetical protein